MGDVATGVEALWQRYGPMVLRRCRQLLQDEEEALDVCQDVFVQLLRRRQLRVEHPSSLLYRIATNLSLNRIRDRRHAPEGVEPGTLEQIAGFEDPGSASEARWLLGKLFSGQQESTRTMAVLHFVDGFTLKQVAAEVGMSLSGVRKRLRALRQSLETMEAS